MKMTPPLPQHSADRKRLMQHPRTKGSSATRRLVAGFAATALTLGGLAGAVTTATAAPRASTTISSALKHFGNPNLGPNVMVFNPSMSVASIQAAFDAVSSQQIANQFGTERYSMLFEPGTYGSASNPLNVQVGYYTQVAGLGANPGDVVVNGAINVYNQCDANGCIALNNFWRSLSNLTINPTGGEGCRANTEFWAVSQAAPMRRVVVNGNTTLMDYCTAGPQYASGGFIADSKFTGSVINGSQQQFIVRNSDLGGGWSNGVWNQVFSGVNGAPAQSFGQTGQNPYTTVAASPITRESPYLTKQSNGSYAVIVPGTARNTSGSSFAADAAGTKLSLNSFFVASAKTSVKEMNRALAQGRNLLLTPGVYSLSQPIRVVHPNAVVLGLGFATLIPSRGNDAVDVINAPGSSISGIAVDAGPRTSDTLINVMGGRGAKQSTLLSDVFFRIGGASAGRTESALKVSASNVILDDIWAWRADHGNGVGWTVNTAPNGVTVTGDNVTAYGLFVEHFQKTEVTWAGNNGTVIFFQNEMPYDVPSQNAWNLSTAIKGYPAFAVSPRVRSFTGYGMGSYSYFNQGLDIHATQAFSAPQRSGVAFHDLLTRFLDGTGGIDSVINGTGGVVNATNPGPAMVVNYP